MEHTHITPREITKPFAPRPEPDGAPVAQVGASIADVSFLKLDCYLCRGTFVLDVDEHWSQDPEEMERIGRRFLSVPPDASLCPRCFHEVELAGAERMYWARAGA